MNTRYQWPKVLLRRSGRNPVRKLRVLPERRVEVTSFCEIHPEWQPMVKLYDRLCTEYGSELFGGVIVGGGLILAAQDSVAINENIVLIHFDPRKRHFLIEHRDRDFGSWQKEECEENAILERVRLFVAYKFGVYRKPNEEL